MNSTEANLPLGDVRVVELGQLLAGPFCAQLLGDYGAEVVKVEDPNSGDPMREWGREKPHGKSLWWPVIARNKKSVTANLRTDAGQDVVRRLVADADIIVENFRPGRMESWGLGYDELVAINPRIVFVRVTGFGQTGPYAERAGFGAIGEAMGGLRHIVGEPDRPPVRVGLSIGDTLAGTMGAMGALVAMHARRSTGRGQMVDSAIFEAVLTYMESLIPEYDIAGYVRERTGAVLPKIAPSNVYPTSDQQMILIGANHDLVFARLAEAMQQPELAGDDRFATHSARGENQEELDRLIAEWTVTLTAEEVLSRVEEHAVPAGRTYQAADMLRDEHFKARESIVTLPHPEFGDFRMQGVFPKLSETPGRVRTLGPELGEHNDEILRGVLGMSEEQVAAAQRS